MMCLEGADDGKGIHNALVTTRQVCFFVFKMPHPLASGRLLQTLEERASSKSFPIIHQKLKKTTPDLEEM